MLREIAELHGKIDRLLAAQPKQDPAPCLDTLVLAAFGVMQTKTWTVAELIGASIATTEQALDLIQAIEATGKTSPKSLGKYLAKNIPCNYLSVDGFEIRRNDPSSGYVTWSVSRV